LKGGEIVTFSIGQMPTVNVSKPDNSSNAAFFQGRPENEFSSFSAILRDTLKSRGRNDIKTAAAEDIKTELVSKAEIKLMINNSKDPEPVYVEDEKPAAEKDINVEVVIAEDVTDKDAIVKELLKKLEKLNSMKDGDDSGGEKQAMLEEIKELLQELMEIRTEISGEEAAVICAMMSEFENVPEKLRDEIITVFEKPVVMKNDIIPTEGFTAEKNPEKDAAAKIVDAKDNLGDESQKPEAKPVSFSKPSVPESKDNESETAAKEENIKAAIDVKIEKVTAEDNPEKGQEKGKSSSSKEAAEETHDTVKIPHNKPDVEGPAVRQEQNVVFDKIETIKNQTEIPKAQPVGKIEIINQIVKKAEVILTGAQSEMRMQLEPENLGKLTLSISVERGLITAKFTAESYEVKQTIESNFNELRDMLQDKGLNIQNLSVSVGHESKEFNFSNNHETWRDKLKAGSKNMRHDTYGGYQNEIGTESAINPYSIHSGRFDQRV